MKNFLWTFVVVGLACSSVALEINYGIYQDLRISVSDNVPRQKCQRALDNLEVRPIFYSLLVKSVSKLSSSGSDLSKQTFGQLSTGPGFDSRSRQH